MVIKNSIIHFIPGEKSLFYIHTNAVFPLFPIRALSMLQNECYYKIFCFSKVNNGLLFHYIQITWKRTLIWLCRSSVKWEIWFSGVPFFSKYEAFSRNTLTLIPTSSHARNLHWCLVFTPVLGWKASLAIVTCL